MIRHLAKKKISTSTRQAATGVEYYHVFNNMLAAALFVTKDRNTRLFPTLIVHSFLVAYL